MAKSTSYRGWYIYYHSGRNVYEASKGGMSLTAPNRVEIERAIDKVQNIMDNMQKKEGA